MVGLILNVAEFSGPRQWRWRLSEEDAGGTLADHEVNLPEDSDEYWAFTDLYGYLRRNAIPDRRTSSEAQIVAQVGEWAGREVLGPAIGAAIIEAAPVTVRVTFPPEARFVAGWPLELAHVGGIPLAARGDVTFVYDLTAGPAQADGNQQVTERLRMLAVFSLPTRTSVLALRRERYELARLVRRIGARDQRRVELAVAQYGVTRKRLAEIAESGDGWDVLHLSGHGGRGQLWLEKADGSPDPVDTAELMRLLAPLRRRVRLAVVSACESAAATMAETLRWVGLEEQADQLEAQAQAPPAGAVPTGLAQALVEHLGCAVVAMRYPVADDFAIAFTGALYRRVLSQGQPLTVALARTLPETAGATPSPTRPPISLATPLLAGPGASGLVLEAPAGEPLLDPAGVRMERFPREPERFVGRTQAMAEASAALAAGSGRSGLLLHGMAGSGKTACALELAYRHQDSFQALAFWQAPEKRDEFAGALASLAAALEIQLRRYGFAMADQITTPEAVEAFAPRLARLLEGRGILLVLDNLETLLTGEGRWRDPRWPPLIAALTGHDGESRVIMTSRIPPAEVAGSVLTLPVHALTLDESAALARELPHLRELLHADASPLRDVDPAAMAADRNLVRRILHVVQGHPKLMELADAAAADPDRLAGQLAAAEADADGHVLDAFFRDGTTSLDAAQFLDALTSWTTTALAALPGSARLMASFLACLEDDDRQRAVVRATWTRLWRRLGRPGEPPGWPSLVAALASAALIQPDQPSGPDPSGESGVLYRMHPGVAQAIRAAADPAVQDSTDRELAGFWGAIGLQEMEREGGEHGQTVVLAGLSAAPYLLRTGDWDTAVGLLNAALHRDRSPGLIQAAVPSLRAIADATGAAEHLRVLALALQSVNIAEAERLGQAALDRAVADEDFRVASAAAGDLANTLWATGRLREALDLLGQKADYTLRAGLGPWTQLADQGRRLQVLGMMGQHGRVLDEISGHQARMDGLPGQRGPDETVDPWNVREGILGVGRDSANALADWQQALDFNQAVLASKRARGVRAHELAYTAFNDYGPLISLGRLDDVEELLTGCQQVFEDNDDLDQLGNVFTARADLESARGNLARALAFQKTGIRFHYLRRDPQDLAVDHFRLANHLRRTGSDLPAQRAHRLAAVLIYQLTGMTYEFSRTCALLASELREIGEQHLPGTVPEVIAVAEQTEGVKLGELLTAIAPDPQATAMALGQIMDTAASMPIDQDGEIQQQLQQWEPVFATALAAVGGDRDAAAALVPFLDGLAEDQDWATLVAVLRRILGGERGEDLLEGLDQVDTAIVTQLLARLTPAQPSS